MESEPEIRILFVEDVPPDAELAERVLAKDGLDFVSRRVETADEYLKELEVFRPDIVISDYSLPVFDGIRALRLLLEYDKSIPFIVFTGSINEETAVKCMKEGATDYVLKDRIKRLPYAVREALSSKTVMIAKEKAEQSLKISEKRLQLAMEVSEQGLWDWNMDTNEAYFSAEWYYMFGYGPDELPRTFDSWKSLLHPEDKEIVIERLMDQIMNLESFEMDFRMRSSSGKCIWLTCRGKPFEIDNEGRPHRVIGTCIDITTRKLAEEQMIRARIAAEEANKYKTELLANITHELKTPLSSVIGFSDVLLEGISGKLTELQEEQVDIINKSGNRLLELINKMLDLSRIESGRMELVYETFSPKYILSVVVNRTFSVAAKKNISVNTTIDPEIGEIKADPNKLTEIIFNLLENSLKFTEEGGAVTIDASKDDFYIYISVTDSGVGILKEDQEKIFEPFVQVDGSTSRKYGGAGLGLVLVKEYAKMHNGEITVESEYGKGSTFTLKLPVCPVANMIHDPFKDQV
ncbi:hybrid sensor histidine kinase/response regulator [Methanolobus bombayensis]|uniref:hybrid sensor histidine kinase/response regulator n=1 Tax=Methanolobus bombayensis TaxID=38023 RepID=UPI001AE52FF2|nr:ATP-binding protein [Methanolobus bombayensis]MBP1907947.1 PAS domain S-box-containing protein [Methanolobus bombayensis]